jgi:hypothetical protein
MEVHMVATTVIMIILGVVTVAVGFATILSTRERPMSVEGDELVERVSGKESEYSYFRTKRGRFVRVRMDNCVFVAQISAGEKNTLTSLDDVCEWKTAFVYVPGLP